MLHTATRTDTLQYNTVSQSAGLQEIRKIQTARVERSSGYLATGSPDICFNNFMIGNKQSNILDMDCTYVICNMYVSVGSTQ